MTANILLVRHGQTRSNVTGFYMGRSDEDLNDVGRAQVRSLSSRLACLPIASVYASPLQRAYTTASIIAEPHKLALEVLDDLIEFHPGDWQGLYIDEISQGWPELWRQWRTDPSMVAVPNGESFSQVAERAVRAFNTILEANQGREVVVATHEIIIKIIVMYALGVSNSIYRRFEINNASLSWLRVTSDNARLIMLNDTSHIEM